MLRSFAFLSLVCILAVTPVVLAHICVFHPKQRGNLSVDIPGSPPCYQRDGQCGTAAVESPVVTYSAGEMVAVHFQQNLNHWYGPTPGNFDVSISYVVENPQDSDFTVLASFSDFPAHDMVWQTNFTLEVKMPEKACDHCVLRSRYVSNNPLEIDPKTNTHAIFYQCSDIAIKASTPSSNVRRTSNLTPPYANPHRRSAPSNASSCCAPAEFYTKAVEVTPGGVVLHEIWYSAAQNQVRWDREGAVEPSTGQKIRLQTITNYTSELEYLNYPDTGVCETYGPDKFYPWCFGDNTMTQVGQETVAGVTCDVWTVPSSGVFWSSTAAGSNGECLPVSTRHQENFMLFTDTNVGPIDPSVFAEPSQCKSARRVH